MPRGGAPAAVADPGSGFDPAATERAVQTAITAAGGHSPMITVSVVDAIPTGAAGKRPLVVALPNSHDGAAVQPHTVGPP